MDEESQQPPEPSVKQDRHEKSISLANEAFKVASVYFSSKDTGSNQRYAHLGSIANLNHVLTIGDAEMTSALQNLGNDIKPAQTIPAIYMGEEVDSVVTREDADVNPIIMLHEFIHRAATLGGLNGQAIPFHDQMYQLLDLSKETGDVLKKDSPDEYQIRLTETKRVIRVFNEGLTQWATIFLANRTPQFNPPVVNKTYTDEVTAVIDSFSSLQDKGLSQDKIEELILDLALTGDFSKIRTVLPLPEHLKKRNFPSDYLITTLIQNTYSKFQLAGFDRILGKQS